MATLARAARCGRRAALAHPSFSGVAFNVPPAAIRIAAQRQPGTQERIDLVYLWPSLAPAGDGGEIRPSSSARK